MDALVKENAAGLEPALFQKLFECLPDAMLVVGAGGSIYQANALAERMFGYTRAQLIGLTVENLIPHRFRNTHPKHRSEYQESPRVRPMGADIDLFALRQDGTEVPVDIMLSPIEGLGDLVLVVIRDISIRKRIQEDLKKSEERYRLLIEGTKDYAIFMLDPAGNIATWNTGAERIKGYRAEEILGKHFSCFYPQEDIEHRKPELELETAKLEGRYEDEGWRIKNDGSRFWANVIITTLRDKDESLIGFLKVTRDLTNRKRAEESLLQELGKVVLSSLDLARVFTAIAGSITRLFPYDLATIAFYDKGFHRLSLRTLSTESPNASEEESPVAIEGTPDGWVYINQQPIFMHSLNGIDFGPKALARYVEAGIKSGCWLPLSSDDSKIGTLFVGSRFENTLKSVNLDMLRELANQIAAALHHTLTTKRVSEESKKLREEKKYLEEELRTEYSFEEIVGKSDVIRRLLKQVETVAPTDASVLILGETGTGKELIARSIHDLSPRRDRTFVKLNCAAIPFGLLESELFGHEKGAFTGAIVQRIGRLELADQGTLFLDEIGDLPLELQPKLLRALQEKEIERLGGRRTIPVDVRLIAATNKDLSKMIQEGQFRSDLYYRLRVFPLNLPPLRDRPTDIPLLVNYFVAKHARRMNKRIDAIPSDVMDAFTQWNWPGNVRELENFIERSVILTPGHILRPPLGELEQPEVISRDRGITDLRATEKEHILTVLRETKGMVGGPGGAAEKLGLKRTTLNSMIKKLEIEKEDYQ